MKKILAIILASIGICASASSQTWEHNLEKYWHYRDRLESDFMIVGQPEKQGTNYPERTFQLACQGEVENLKTK